MGRQSTLFGWLGVLACLLIMVLFQGALGNQSGLLMDPICNSLGISRTTFSTLFTIVTISNLLCSLTFTKFLKVLGIKKMTLLGALGALLYCALLVAADKVGGGAVSIVLIAIGHFCFGVCFSWSGAMSVSILINNWFAKRADTMISVVSAFCGLAGIVAAPLVTSWITSAGWEASLIYRGIPVAVTFVLFFFIIRVEPHEGDKRIWENSASESKGEGKTADSGVMLAEARKSLKFWAGIVATFGLGCFMYPAASLCLPALASDFGYAQQSGTVMSVLFAANLVAMLVLGSLVEKFGCRKAFVPVLIISVAAMVMLSVKSIGLVQLYIAASMLGIGYALVSVAVPLLTMEAFGPKDFGSIQSFLFSAQVLGMVVGSPLFNALYDLSGSYSPAYIMGAVACAVMAAAVIITTKKARAI